MLGLLIAKFASLGVAERFRRPLGYLTLAIAAIVLLGLLRAIYDHHVISTHEDKREARASAAREEAAEEQASDTIRNTRNEKDLHDAIDRAIDAAPNGGALSPAALALNCERLRKLGRVPEACRPARGGGAQAGPD